MPDMDSDRFCYDDYNGRVLADMPNAHEHDLEDGAFAINPAYAISPYGHDRNLSPATADDVMAMYSPHVAHVTPAFHNAQPAAILRHLQPGFTTKHNSGSCDMEQVKLEKKRERNRIAASKCRQRKLEKISTLEDQVRNLKRDNECLRVTSERLRAEVERMRAQIEKHVNNGCQIGEAGLDADDAASQQHPVAALNV